MVCALNIVNAVKDCTSCQPAINDIEKNKTRRGLGRGNGKATGGTVGDCVCGRGRRPTSCQCLGQDTHLSGPQFPHLQ